MKNINRIYISYVRHGHFYGAWYNVPDGTVMILDSNKSTTTPKCKKYLEFLIRLSFILSDILGTKLSKVCCWSEEFNTDLAKGFPDLGFWRFLQIHRRIPDRIVDAHDAGIIKTSAYTKLPKNLRGWTLVNILPTWWEQQDGTSCGLYTFLGFLYFMDDDVFYRAKDNFAIADYQGSMNDVRELMVGIQCCFFNRISEGGGSCNLTDQLYVDDDQMVVDRHILD